MAEWERRARNGVERRNGEWRNGNGGGGTAERRGTGGMLERRRDGGNGNSWNGGQRVVRVEQNTLVVGGILRFLLNHLLRNGNSKTTDNSGTAPGLELARRNNSGTRNTQKRNTVEHYEP